MMDETDRPTGNAGQIVTITRETLQDPGLFARLRARAPSDMAVMTETELEASLDASLANLPAGEDAWLFGYGSLMWNPAILYAEKRLARVRGWHRRYCLVIRMGRGTPDCPGLMLALDRGGSCNGIAFRIPAAQARDELLLAWRREMFGGSYAARWMTAHTEQGPVRAVTFVANRKSARYDASLTEAQIVDCLSSATGELGSCASYLFDTTESLRAVGVRDPTMERLRRLVESRGRRGTQPNG